MYENRHFNEIIETSIHGFLEKDPNVRMKLQSENEMDLEHMIQIPGP